MDRVLKEIQLPIRLRTKVPMNDEHLMRFCAANSDLRIEREADGELVIMAPSGSEGGSIEFEIGRQLARWTDEDRRGKMFEPSSGFRLPDKSVRAADASWVSLSRWKRLSTNQQQGYAPVCPEFVIEVRSQSDRLPPLHRKMESWIANGAEVAWLIDIERDSVWIYRAGEPTEFLDHPSSVNGTGPVEGFVLSLD